MIMVAVFLPEMCRRHMISITPHEKRASGSFDSEAENAPACSVGVKTRTLKISVSERRDL